MNNISEQEFIDFIHSVGDEYHLRACILMLAKKPKQRQQLVDFIKENNLTCFNVGKDVTAYKNCCKIDDKTWELYEQSGGKVYYIDNGE